jgi:GT2 family glycosyltransferase
MLDGAKNPESGIRSKMLQRLAIKPTIDLVGCNFSCHKDALERLNGFNEEYTSPGLGEDSDLQERFKKIGVAPKSAKYLAPLFHLFHPRNYKVSEENQRLYLRTKESEVAHCGTGLREANQFNGDKRVSS